MLHWNVAYGRGTDNIVDLNRQANWMANMQPDLISLNEVPPENIQTYVNLLQQKTGRDLVLPLGGNHAGK